MIFQSAVFIYIFVLISTVAFGFSHANAQEERSVIKIGTIEYPPFRRKNLPNGGFLPDLTKHLFESLGYKVEIEFKPFKRVYKETIVGKLDAILGLWHRDFREQFFNYGPAIYYSELYAVKRIDYILPKTNLPFPPVRLGITRGSAPPQHFIDHASWVEESTDEDASLKKLAAGRVDIAYVEKYVLAELLKHSLKNFSTTFETIEKYKVREPLHIAFSKKSPFQSLSEPLNEAYLKFIQTPSYSRLISHHMVKQN